MAQFTNQAQLSYNNSVANSNVAVGEILEVLSATKTALVETYESEDTVTYVVTITNSGTLPYVNLTFQDNLGGYLFGTAMVYPLDYVDGSLRYYVNGTLQTPPAITAGPPLEVTGLSVPAGQNATIVYETKVNQYAPLDVDSTITNTATISGTGITNVTVQEVISSVDSPRLGINKSISPVPVTENGTLTYTFVITNTGNTLAVASDLAAITDTFNPILSNLSVSFIGTPWVETTNYTYTQTTGVFATVPGQITVPAATYTQNTETGAYTIIPGTSTLTVTGTI